MSTRKTILLLLIITAACVDARARRKRRQLSSASYYISDVNPYTNSYSPSAPLTYPSGSFYNAPSYGTGNIGYSHSDQPYMTYSNMMDPNSYSSAYMSNYNAQYPYGTQQAYAYPNLGSSYGSGLYGADGTLSYGFSASGFNNRYPNWHQGNINQYYTGGTGSGLSNPGYQWYRSLRNIPFQPRSANGLNLAPVEVVNPSLSIEKPTNQ